MFRTSFIMFAAIILVSACSSQPTPTTSGAFDTYSTDEQNTVQIDNNRQASKQRSVIPTKKVAILLPLTGPHKAIGDSLLNAAQLALFDINDPSVELLPIDTKGTVSGTGEAMFKASQENVQLILGPLLSENVKRAGLTAKRYNLNVIGFTTDSNVTGDNVFTVGILPYDQGQRLAQFANKNRLNRVVAIVTDNQYAREVTQAFEQSILSNGSNTVRKISMTANDSVNAIAQNIAAEKEQFDAILMPFGNPQLSSMAQALSANGLGANNITWLGAGVWDDTNIISNALMQNAYYAAPSTQTRQSFERQYQTIFNQTPARLSSLGYDATALAIVLLRQTNGRINRNALLNSNGFSGVDGVFRFKQNGMTERGMAIHRISGAGSTNIAEQAPKNFKTSSSRY